MNDHASRFPITLALAIIAASALACDKPEPEPTTAKTQPQPDQPVNGPSEAPAPSEPSTPKPEPPRPSDAEPPRPAPRDTVEIGGVRRELGWSFQLATKKKREDAELLRGQLEIAAVGLTALGKPYVLARDDFYLIMAGSFDDEAEAKRHFELAKTELEQGGFIRAMREFCPGQRRDAEQLFTCVEVELPADVAPPIAADPWLAEADADTPAAEREPYDYPSPAGPDPAAITHPPAEQLLVIASNRGYSPGQLGVDRDGKYRTWIWRPTLGGLPAKGKFEPTVPSEDALIPSAPQLVEIHKTLVLSDGAQLWQVEPDTRDIQLPLCPCLFGEAGNPTKTLRKRLVELRAQPLTGGAGITLIDAEDFPHKRASECIEERDYVDHVIQIQAVAGSRLLVVERNVERQPCPELEFGSEAEPIIFDTRSERILDLRGTYSLAQLEAELPYAVVKDARFKASAALTKATTASYDELGPSAVLLTGVFARYREVPRGMRLTLQYSVEGTGDVGGWGLGFDSHTVQVDYPASSSLAPPQDIRPLMAYISREYQSWRVIGWSRHTPTEPAVAPAPSE